MGNRGGRANSGVRYVTVPQNQTNGVFVVDGQVPRYDCGCMTARGRHELLAWCPHSTVAQCSAFCNQNYGQGGGKRPCPRVTWNRQNPILSLGVDENPNTFVPALNGPLAPCVDVASWRDTEGRDCAAYTANVTLCTEASESDWASLEESCCACRGTSEGEGMEEQELLRDPPSSFSPAVTEDTQQTSSPSPPPSPSTTETEDDSESAPLETEELEEAEEEEEGPPFLL